MIRVLIVDDQPIVRTGLRALFASAEGITVSSECEDGSQVAGAVRRHRPDVVLMDVRMPVMDGVTATTRLRALPDAPAVLVLTTFSDDDVLWGAVEAGAAGFVLKDSTAEDIIRAVQVVAAGGAWLDPKITPRVLERHRRAWPRDDAARRRLDRLTTREREVLVAMATGASNAEIGRALQVSEATVKTHVASIFLKLDLRDRAAAIVLAFRQGVAHGT